MVRQIFIPVVLQPRSRSLWSENGQDNGIVYDYCAQHCLSAHVHCGHDVEAIFEPIFAATDGVVLFAGFDGVYTPNHVDIEPISGPFRGEYHIYGHLSEAWVATGQRVSRGQQIGVTGTNCVDRQCSTLHVGNDHLHWERRAGFHGCCLDPDAVLTSPNANGGEGPVDGGGASGNGGFQRQDAIRVADGPLRLRQGPGSWFPVLHELPNGARLCVTGESQPGEGNTWYPVFILNINLPGWVAGQFCVLDASGGCGGFQESAPVPESAAPSGRPMSPHGDSGPPNGVTPEMTNMPIVEYDANGVFAGVSFPARPPLPEITPAADTGSSPFANG